MRWSIKRKYGNFFKGRLPNGCKLCMEGAKLVLFVTGVCDRNCPYCPLSEMRRGKDCVWANERPVKSPEDLVKEAELMGALGAGITGGEPAIVKERVINFMEILKREFGDEFHIHMYTSKRLDRDTIEELYSKGLDELRFHSTVESDFMLDSISISKEIGLCSGSEVPSMPDRVSDLISLAKSLKEINADFLNLNELEVTETNYRALKDLGYSIGDISVQGSKEAALKVIKSVDFNIHFCSASFKDGVQLRKRFIRTSLRIAREYEYVNEDGLIVIGVIEHPEKEKLLEIMKEISHRYNLVEGKEIYLNLERGRIETSPEVMEILVEEYQKEGVRYYLVEEYPIYGRPRAEVIPLG